MTRTSWHRACATVEIPGNQVNGEDLNDTPGVVAQSPAQNNDNSRHRARATVEIPGNQANGEDLNDASGVVAQSSVRNDDNK